MNGDRNIPTITNRQIRNLEIAPEKCIDWAMEALKIKYECQMPAKTSVHPLAIDFFTSMPCLLPQDYGIYGVKIVHRIKNQIPALGSDILLYNSKTGELLAFLDGDWITAMRTGAVAALAVDTFKKLDAHTIAIIGLGNIARTVVLCLDSLYSHKDLYFRLFRYKNQAELFIERFKHCPNMHFEIVSSMDDFIKDADVVISCITETSELLCANDNLYGEGILVVPVHTRGFQNCDLFFDKVFGDDTHHIQKFSNFSRFKHFEEFSKVLLKKAAGRETDTERILCYNVGIALQDIVFSHHIYNMFLKSGNDIPSFLWQKEEEKFWI